MLIKRFLSTLVALTVLAACADTPTSTELAQGPSLAIVGQGQGAVVDHFSDEALILLTIDPEAGLYSVHYTDSDQLSAFVGCPVPVFHGALDALSVLTPSNKQHVRGVGETYVIVNDAAGFPANICAPIAEGTVRLTLSVTQVPEGSPGQPSASFASNGVISVNSDGSPVRLHHLRKGLQQPLGTVSLR